MGSNFDTQLSAQQQQNVIGMLLLLYHDISARKLQGFGFQFFEMSNQQLAQSRMDAQHGVITHWLPLL